MLSITRPARPHRRAQDPEGTEPEGQRRRGARHHGPERLGQEHARRACSPAARATRSRPATSSYLGQDLLAMEPEERARAGVFLAFQYPVEIPGVNNAYLLKAALNAVRKHAWPARARRLRVPGAGAREDEAHADGRELPQPRRQRGFLRRREEAQRDPADGAARTEARAARRDRLGPRHRRAAGGGRRRQRACAPRIARSCW